MDIWEKLSSAILGFAFSFALISYFQVNELEERVEALESQLEQTQ